MAKVLSDIKKSVKSVASTTKRKTKALAEVTKLKLDIKMEEANLDHCFEQLGRAVYAGSKSSNNDKKIKELLEKADNISKTIKDYKSRLAFVQGKRVCPHCESVVDTEGPCKACREKIVANERCEASSNDETADSADDFQVEVIIAVDDEGKENEDQVLVVDEDE